MHIARLDVAQVRNLESVSVELCRGLNLFAGSNGAGKTSLLEAVHLLFRGRSFRTPRTSSVIRESQDALSVFARCEDPARGAVAIGVRKDRQNRTELRLDGQSVKQASVVAGLMPLQVFLPDLSDLVFGGPEVRRQWLDWGTFHVKPGYLDTLKGYTRTLRQRNAILKSEDRSTLSIWTERLAGVGAEVHEARLAYLHDTLPSIETCARELGPELELELRYQPGFSAQTLLDALAQSEVSDVKSGVTRVGPHRADVRILSGGAHASGYLSRGQGKVAASAMRLGQAVALETALGRKSLFLIDDVGAELDELNNHRFFERLSDLECQILATTTHPSSIGDTFRGDRRRMFHVKHGAVSSNERPTPHDE